MSRYERKRQRERDLQAFIVGGILFAAGAAFIVAALYIGGRIPTIVN